MNIVLVRPPFYALFGVNNPKMKTYPLNLLYLATYIRKKTQHQAYIVDGENCAPAFNDSATDPEERMQSAIPEMISIINDPEHAIWIRLESAIMDKKPDLVGITCNSGNMDTVRTIVQKLKKFQLPVILGGSHPTVLPEQSMRYTSADYVISGEGEIALSEFMNALSSKQNLLSTASLCWRDGDEIHINRRGNLVENLDEIPFPDRSIINREDYFGDVLMTGRGCPFDCAYCASRNIWGRRVRLRSVDSIIGELRQIKKFNEESLSNGPGPANAHVIKIVDDTFTVNKNRTIDLLDRIIELNWRNVEFTGGVRADTLDEKIVDKMALAGFKRVTLGVESGSPKILKLIRKGETNQQVSNAINLLRNAGIRSHAFFMVGFPTETPEDIELSKKLILQARPDYVEVNMVTPYPGTDLFNQLVSVPPSEIDRWYRWFHQGLSTHSDRIGFDLDKEFSDFSAFAKNYNRAVNS